MGGFVPTVGIQGPEGPEGPPGPAGAGTATLFGEGAVALAHSSHHDTMFTLNHKVGLVTYAFIHNTSADATNVSMDIYAVDPTTPGAVPCGRIFGNGAFSGQALAAGAYIYGPMPQVSAALQGMAVFFYCDNNTDFWVRVYNTGFANDITYDLSFQVVYF